MARSARRSARRAGLRLQTTSATFPPFCKAYDGGLPVVALPREWAARGGGDGGAGRRGATRRATRRPRAGAPAVPLVRRRADLASRSGGAGCSAPPARPAGGSRSRSTSRPAASPASMTACTGTTRSTTRSSRSGRPPTGEATTLVVTGVPWRTGWKYAERGFRHIYWDAGTMLAQALALAGRRPRLWTRFPDAEVTRLVGADGMHEFPVALVALGDGEPAIRPRARRRPAPIDVAAARVPARHAGAARRRRRRARRALAGRPSARRGEPPPRPTSTTSSCAAARRAGHGRDRDGVPRASSTGRWPPRCAALASRTSSPSTPSRGSSRGSTAGPTSTARCAAGRCARRCCASAGTRTSAATPPSS